MERLSLFALKALINGIEKDYSVRESNIVVIQERLTNVSDLMETIKALNDSINAQLIEIGELKALISTRTDRRRRTTRDADKVRKDFFKSNFIK